MQAIVLTEMTGMVDFRRRARYTAFQNRSMTRMQSSFGTAETIPASVFYLGDSHTAYLKTAATNFLFYPRNVSGYAIGGATAVGMRNPNAMVDALSRFRTEMGDTPRDSIVVLQLGEADCSFVMWYLADTQLEEIGDQVAQSVGAYFQFVDALLADGFTRIVITSATLPTITDDDIEDGLFKTRGAIRVSQSQRTALTLAYNAALQIEAHRRALQFVDLNQDFLDPDTGLLRRSFRNSLSDDHHMDYWRAAIVWADNLNPILDALDPPLYEKREWVAVSDTVAKALPRHSRDLAEGEKMFLGSDDTLSADFHGEAGEYFVASQASINGLPIPPRIRLFHRAHWRLSVQPIVAESFGESPSAAEEQIYPPPAETAPEPFLPDPLVASEPMVLAESPPWPSPAPGYAEPPAPDSRDLAALFRRLKQRITGKT